MEKKQTIQILFKQWCHQRSITVAAKSLFSKKKVISPTPWENRILYYVSGTSYHICASGEHKLIDQLKCNETDEGMSSPRYMDVTKLICPKLRHLTPICSRDVVYLL